MAHNGGTKVNYGFYWSAKAWDMAMIPAEGGLLRAGRTATTRASRPSCSC